MDEDTEELTKRRLIEAVRDGVQKQLFRTYALVGTAVIIALGYANWDFIEDTKENVRLEASKAVQDAIDAVQADLDELRSAVDQQTGRIASERDRARVILAEVTTQLSHLDVETHNIASLNETVGALTEARRHIEEGLAEVTSRTEKLSVVADELKSLAEELKRISPESNAAVNKVLDNVLKAERKAKVLAKRSTVYLQFAVGTRSTAQELARQLAARGYIVPGEERHGGATGKREVRYFYQEDREGAESLLTATAEALRDMGYADQPKVKLEDLTNYTGQKPKAGILELWIEL